MYTDSPGGSISAVAHYVSNAEITCCFTGVIKGGKQEDKREQTIFSHKSARTNDDDDDDDDDSD